MNNYVEKLEDELSQKDYSMVMCVLRNNRTDVYNVIKKLTLSSYGISSQVFKVPKTVEIKNCLILVVIR